MERMSYQTVANDENVNESKDVGKRAEKMGVGGGDKNKGRQTGRRVCDRYRRPLVIRKTQSPLPRNWKHSERSGASHERFEVLPLLNLTLEVLDVLEISVQP